MNSDTCWPAVRERWRRPVVPDLYGILFASFYLTTAVVYFTLRITTTLYGLEHPVYARLVLAVEMAAAFNMLIFCLHRLVKTKTKAIIRKGKNRFEEQQKRAADADANMTIAALPLFYVHVLVCTYTEGLDVLGPTLQAAVSLDCPEHCLVKVYCCDDQTIPKSSDTDAKTLSEAKQKVCKKLGIHHFRRKGVQNWFAWAEPNGKSCNIGHALSKIFDEPQERQQCPEGTPEAVPETEEPLEKKPLTGRDIIMVLDCDHVVSADFLKMTLPVFFYHKDVAMVITRQNFRNVDPDMDVLNHINADYFELMQPGMDALDFISCPGTNFLVRATALQENRIALEREGEEWFPNYTVTEDFALGMELKTLGKHAVYIDADTLSKGNAPNRVYDSFKQRYRWTMGHFQIFFSSHNPLLRAGLTNWMRFLYSTTVITYLTSILATITFCLVPLMNLWFGWFPAQVTKPFVFSFMFYTLASILVKSIGHHPGKPSIRAMWFASVANNLFCPVYILALLKSPLLHFSFEVTPHGGAEKEKWWEAMMLVWQTFTNAVWLHILFFLVSIFTVVCTLLKLIRTDVSFAQLQGDPVLICLLWVLYNILPHFMLMCWSALHRCAYAYCRKSSAFEPDQAATSAVQAEPSNALSNGATCMSHQGSESKTEDQSQPSTRNADAEGMKKPPAAEELAKKKVGRAQKTDSVFFKPLLRLLCSLTQYASLLLLILIIGATVVVAYNPNGITYCGLFPFCFAHNVCIPRLPHSHHPNCPGIVF